jgi:hypothetical protein
MNFKPICHGLYFGSLSLYAAYKQDLSIPIHGLSPYLVYLMTPPTRIAYVGAHGIAHGFDRYYGHDHEVVKTTNLSCNFIYTLWLFSPIF